MSKQNKSKEYTRFIMRCEHCAHKMECKYFKGDEEPEDFGCDADEISSAFGVGWDAALENILVDASKELPEYEESVWVINEKGEQFYCHRTNNEIAIKDKDGWCNYTDSNIIAWMPIPSFDEILKANKDVLKRLKDK